MRRLSERERREMVRYFVGRFVSDRFHGRGWRSLASCIDVMEGMGCGKWSRRGVRKMFRAFTGYSFGEVQWLVRNGVSVEVGENRGVNFVGGERFWEEMGRDPHREYSGCGD